MGEGGGEGERGKGREKGVLRTVDVHKTFQAPGQQNWGAGGSVSRPPEAFHHHHPGQTARLNAITHRRPAAPPWKPGGGAGCHGPQAERVGGVIRTRRGHYLRTAQMKPASIPCRVIVLSKHPQIQTEEVKKAGGRGAQPPRPRAWHRERKTRFSVCMEGQ